LMPAPAGGPVDAASFEMRDASRECLLVRMLVGKTRPPEEVRVRHLRSTRSCARSDRSCARRVRQGSADRRGHGNPPTEAPHA